MKLNGNLQFLALGAELQNAIIERLASDPATTENGRIYYNTTANEYRYYNGSAWAQFGDATLAGNINDALGAITDANGDYDGTAVDAALLNVTGSTDLLNALTQLDGAISAGAETFRIRDTDGNTQVRTETTAGANNDVVEVIVAGNTQATFEASDVMIRAQDALELTGGAANVSGAVNITAGSPDSGNDDGGQISITTGDGYGTGNGGPLSLYAGQGVGGGSVTIQGGYATSDEGGAINLTTGEGPEAGSIALEIGDTSGDGNNGGNIIMTAGAHTGAVTNGGGGNISMSAGSGKGTGYGGDVTLNGGYGEQYGGSININAGNTNYAGTFGGNISMYAGSNLDTTGGNGGYAGIYAGNGYNGGAAYLNAGNGTGAAAQGGNLVMYAGQGTGTNTAGGNVQLYAGGGSGTGNAGGVVIGGGSGIDGLDAAGSVQLEGGDTTGNADAGNINLIPGTATGDGDSGTVRVVGTGAGLGARMRLYEGNNPIVDSYIELKAPDATADDTTYTLPVAPAASGYILASTTGGIMSWIDPAGTGATLALGGLTNVTDNTTTETNEFILSDGAGGWVSSTIAPSDNGLLYLTGGVWTSLDMNFNTMFAEVDTTQNGGVAAGDMLVYDAGGAWQNQTAAQVRTNLSLVVGTDVQAWDAQLDDIAALDVTQNDNFIVSDGVNWTQETPAQVRTTLGLGTMALETAGDYLLLAGGTMNSAANVVFAGGGEVTGLPAIPTGATAATSKAYVDALVSSNVVWLDPIAQPDLVAIVNDEPATPIISGMYIAYNGSYPQTWTGGVTVNEYDMVHWRSDGAGGFQWDVDGNIDGVETRIGVAFNVAGLDTDEGALDEGFPTGMVKDDLTVYTGSVGADPTLISNWDFPHGRAGTVSFSLVSTTSATKTIVVSGNVLNSFKVNNAITIAGSTGGTNDGTYTIQSVTFNSPNTDIVVAETVPADDGATGTAAPEFRDGQTVLTFNDLSSHSGESYSYSDSQNKWVIISGPGNISAGVGLSLTGQVLNVNLGSGIIELPSDQVGIDLRDQANSALILTTDGTSRENTNASARLWLLLASGGGLTQDSTGLYIDTAGVTNTMLANSGFDLTDGTTTETVALGDTLTTTRGIVSATDTLKFYGIENAAGDAYVVTANNHSQGAYANPLATGQHVIIRAKDDGLDPGDVALRAGNVAGGSSSSFIELEGQLFQGGSEYEGGNVTIGAGLGSSGYAGGDVIIDSGVSDAGDGGNIAITSGSGGNSSGNINIETANPPGAANSGAIALASGNAGTGGTGNVVVSTGNSNGGQAGTVNILGGNGTNADSRGGTVNITAGNSGGEESGGSINITAGQANYDGQQGGYLGIFSGGIGSGATYGDGGELQIGAGSGKGSGQGGEVTITGGDGGATGGAGALNLRGGNGNDSNDGGNGELSGGSATGTGKGGDVFLQGGPSTSGEGGRIRMRVGNGSGSSDGDVRIIGPDNSTAPELRIYESSQDLSGANYIGLTVADNGVTSSITYQLPEAPAVSGYVLASTTGGVMSWVDTAAIGATRVEDLNDITAVTSGGGEDPAGSVLVKSAAGATNYAADLIQFNYDSTLNGGAATSHTVTHNLGQRYVNVTVYDSTHQQILPQSVTLTDANTVTVTFNTAIECYVVVMGVPGVGLA